MIDNHPGINSNKIKKGSFWFAFQSEQLLSVILLTGTLTLNACGPTHQPILKTGAAD